LARKGLRACRGNGPALWLNMQSAYDLSRAEHALANVLEKTPTRDG
jgi:plasmid maintenance system antidote protein VapI